MHVNAEPRPPVFLFAKARTGPANRYNSVSSVLDEGLIVRRRWSRISTNKLELREKRFIFLSISCNHEKLWRVLDLFDESNTRMCMCVLFYPEEAAWSISDGKQYRRAGFCPRREWSNKSAHIHAHTRAHIRVNIYTFLLVIVNRCVHNSENRKRLFNV